MKKTLFENFSWTFIGSALYAFSQWLLVIILAKVGSVEEVGLFSLGLAVTAPIILFFNMQMRNLVATDIHNEYSFSEYLSNRIGLHGLSLLLIISISIINGYDKTVFLVVFLIGTSKVIESLSELTHGYFQKKERMDIAAKSLMYKSISSIVTFSLVYIVTRSLILGLLGLNIAWLLRLIFFDLKNIIFFENIKVSIKISKELTMFAFPLALVSMLNSLNSNIPRFTLERFGGLEALGYFSAMIYLLVAGRLLINPLSLVMTPRLARRFKQGKVTDFLKILLTLILIAITLGIILLLIIFFFGKDILKLVYTEDYAAYNQEFFLIMVGSVISYLTIFLNASIVATGKFKKQAYINFMVFLVGVISSIYFIPRYSVWGASVVTVVIFLTQFIGSLLYLYILIRKELKK